MNCPANPRNSTIETLPCNTHTSALRHSCPYPQTSHLSQPHSRFQYARSHHLTFPRRSGNPHWPSISSSPTAPEWSTSVSWQKGDVLDPSSYTSHLDGADAVIHTMGILLEADYKGVVSGRESPIAGLKRAFSATKQGTQNPLGAKGETLRPLEKDGQITYEIMNRDTGMWVLWTGCE
jgi:hypothetical protein